MAAQIVFRTQGVATVFSTTVASSPTFLSGSRSSISLSTIASFPAFLTSSRSVSFITTTANWPVFLTQGSSVVFLTTPPANPTKLLVLEIGTLTINSDQTYVDVPDATPTYDPLDPTLYPGGYNPETSPTTNPNRPKRTQVNLWTCYKIHSRTTASGYGDNTLMPSTQPDEAEVPYEYSLYFPTEVVGNDTVVIKGLYEIILIAAPISVSYSNYVGNTNLASLADQLPNWYIASAPLVVDPALMTCLNNKRYEFLQGVMCGHCDDGYLYFYADYVGMLSAMEIGDWTTANQLYDKLKNQCSEVESSCGC